MIALRAMVVVLIGFILLSDASADNKKHCTREEAVQAEDAVDSLNDWDSIYQVFKRFAHCDDGAISEGYSDAVGRLLADDWAHFRRLSKLCSTSKKFRRFVLKHIDETIPVDVLQKIVDNTRLNCPAGAKELCKKIEKAASAGWEPEMK